LRSLETAASVPVIDGARFIGDLGHDDRSPIREEPCANDEIDSAGTAFRYADEQARTMKYQEYWLDFVQFKLAMATQSEA
jgi:hypothetical protein